MKILVTGGTGFIGTHLVKELVKNNEEVYSLERYVTARYALPKDVMTFFGDLKDAFKIKEIIRKVQPDAVIHLAAISAVSYSYDHPQEVFEVNTLGTLNLAESCLREIPHFRHFLFAGTSEEYGCGHNSPIPETAELRPNSPYAVSKVAADRYLQYMRDAYDFPITILRPFNTYDRSKTGDRHFVVEKIITQMLEAKKEVLLGDPSPKRDLLYVADHVSAYLTCLYNEKAIGNVFNFGQGESISMAELANKIADIIGWSGDIIWHTIPKRPLDIDTLEADISKGKAVLGWKPKYSLENGLEKAINNWRNRLFRMKS